MRTIDDFKIIVVPKARKDMHRIYDYIANVLYNEIAADNLMKKVNKEIERIKYSPYEYEEINSYDDFGRKYRRIIIKNYIILYTIDEKYKKIYISNMFYGRRNYLI